MTDDHLYLAMEYFARGDLRKRMSEGLTARQSLAYARDLAYALEAIHEVGIFHRDLKPGNVMLRDDGSIALIDFGLAKHVALKMEVTDKGLIFGTPHYMSPEQGHGKPIDRAGHLRLADALRNVTGKNPRPELTWPPGSHPGATPKPAVATLQHLAPAHGQEAEDRPGGPRTREARGPCLVRSAPVSTRAPSVLHPDTLTIRADCHVSEHAVRRGRRFARAPPHIARLRAPAWVRRRKTAAAARGSAIARRRRVHGDGAIRLSRRPVHAVRCRDCARRLKLSSMSIGS